MILRTSAVAVVIAAAASLCGNDASARNRNRDGNDRSYEREMRDQSRAQAEMERQIREQEREQEQAQREAEREAQRLQAEFAAQQRRDQQQAEREAERERQRAEREMQAAQEAAQREAQRAAEREAQRAAEREAQQAERDAQQAAREARRAEQEARASQQDSDRRSNDQRWNERVQNDQPLPAAELAPTRSADRSDDDQGSGRADDRRNSGDTTTPRKRLAAEPEPPREAFRRNMDERVARIRARLDHDKLGDAEQEGAPRGGVLTGLQSHAERLTQAGAGAKRAGGSDRKTEKAASKDRKDGGAAADKGGADKSRRAARDGDRRRRDRVDERAELPPEAFERARDGELVVSELSPEDLATARANGFEVSAPVQLGSSGVKVQRIYLPDASGAEAERELHRMMSLGSVFENHAYKIFLGSEGEAARELKKKTGPASSAPCPDTACFGRKLINWTAKLARCGRDVRIGIIDTSFDTAHPTFKTLDGAKAKTFLEGEAPSPYDWHGTAVLSLLAGDPAGGTPGLLPDATFLLATAFRSDVNGNASTDTVRLLAALAWLEEQGVDIVNMSFSGPEDPALARAIARMSKKGILFVAAAGNMGPTAQPSYPAAYPNVIAVTAVNRSRVNYQHANRGSYIDFSAPGVDVLMALPSARQGYRSGTSFAAPFVTAILAAENADLPRSVAKAKIVSRLARDDLGPPGQDPMFGVGLALAPAACGGGNGGPVAVAEPEPIDPWAAQTTTTFVDAGAVSR